MRFGEGNTDHSARYMEEGRGRPCTMEDRCRKCDCKHIGDDNGALRVLGRNSCEGLGTVQSDRPTARGAHRSQVATRAAAKV